MTQQLNIIQILLDASIVVKTVLFILLLFSVCTWAIVFTKTLLIRKVKKENLDFIYKLNHENNWRKLEEESYHFKNSSFVPIYQALYRECLLLLDKMKSNDFKALESYFEKRGFTSTGRILENAVKDQMRLLESSLSFLASIGSTSLFVGLFGTVWGIIHSFTGLARGGGSIEVIAPGIAEALVATAIGLVVAIPAVWFYNSLMQKISLLEEDMQSFEKILLNKLEKKIFLGQES